jgi:hypothetical protein
VSAIDIALMAGAANITAGSIIAQEMSQAKIQLGRNFPVSQSGELATAAAMQTSQSRLNDTKDEVAVAAWDSQHSQPRESS